MGPRSQSGTNHLVIYAYKTSLHILHLPNLLCKLLYFLFRNLIFKIHNLATPDNFTRLKIVTDTLDKICLKLIEQRNNYIMLVSKTDSTKP